MKLKLTVKDKVMNAAMRIKLSKLVSGQLIRYKANIRKIDIQVSDIRHARHGALKLCHISLVMPGLPDISVKAKGKDLLQALMRALHNSQLVLAQKYKLS
ncbi:MULTISPECIES: hypothetical protein [Pseudoalteromonas]|uniref:Uncharacterized protein n=1 Tax=Pseudoalteromonas aurantia 208 TaxID=1314867 RepID=A0ABR9EGT4_9GAMM|nr:MULTISPECIES: hypothetical protein [Pseudoalteromonas]MBE0370206.1 hypothetical protein [Pseudoalteromonas aurantia 208]